MWKKLLDALTKNWLLKLLALVFAIGLWFSVVNINDPDQTKRFTIPVDVINDSVLTDAGKYYNITGDSDTVTIRVTAARSVMDKLTTADFTAVADMNRLENNTQIPVDITVNKYASRISLSARTYYLFVSVGKLDTNKFMIKAKSVGKPAEGYTTGSIAASPNVLTISGPEEEVAKVSEVRATCDVTGMNQDVIESVVPTLYDKNGKKLSLGSLTLSANTVDVSVEILSTKTVPIDIETSGTLAEGLTLDSVTANPKEVTIKGTADAVNAVSTITIDGSAVSLDNVASDTEVEVDLTSYLPEGVSLVDSDDSKIQVSIKLLGETNSTVTYPTSSITLENVPSGYEGSFTDSSVTIQVTGQTQVIAELTPSAVVASVDAKGLEEGIHTVTLKLTMPTGVTAQETTARLKIAKSATSKTDSDSSSKSTADKSDSDSSSKSGTDSTN